MDLRRAADLVARKTSLKPLLTSSTSAPHHRSLVLYPGHLRMTDSSTAQPSSQRCRFSTTTHRRAQTAAREKEDEAEEGDNNDSTRPTGIPANRVRLGEQHIIEKPKPLRPSPLSSGRRGQTSSYDFLKGANVAGQEQSRQQRAAAAAGSSSSVQGSGPAGNPPGSKPATSKSFNPRAAGQGIDLSFLRERPSTLTPRRPAPAAGPTTTLAPEAEAPVDSKDDPFSSLEAILAGLGRAPSTSSTSSSSTSTTPRGPLNINDIFPAGSGHGKAQYRENLERTMRGPSFRLSPALGRSFVVDRAKGADVAKAFRGVEIACSVGSVKRDFQAQRFHERPGMKRKRLAKVRWRRRFMGNFKAVCRRVEELRKQGW